VVALLMLQGVVLLSDEGGLGPAKLSTSDLSYWADPEAGAHIEQLFRLYGSVPRTMMTLFMPVCGGMDWHSASRPVAHLNAYFTIIWVAYVTFMFIGLLNVLVGVFVDGAMKAIQSDGDQMLRDELETIEATISRITQIFMASDTNCSGYLDLREFEAMLNNPQLVAQLKMIQLDTSQALTIFRLCDRDRSGTVSHDEFIGGCLRLRGSARSTDMLTLLYQSEKNNRQLGRIAKETVNLRKQLARMPTNVAMACANRGMSTSAAASFDTSEPWITPWNLRDS